jgi:hypothetical protein
MSVLAVESRATPWPDRDRRGAAWRAAGAGEAEVDELLAYAASPLHASPPPAAPPAIMADAPFVTAWERYAAAAGEVGAEVVLRRVFVQLAFAVRPGMSADPVYLAATRRGLLLDEGAPGIEFARPQGLRIFLHPTPAGRVPVVLSEDRRDFEVLVQAITRRNEPEPVLASMGACMVSGYNNWDRVAELRRAYEAENPDEAWSTAFRELVPRTDLYQDRFMLLSSGPYSAVPADAIGMDEAAWQAASIQLRLEHECTHYFTRQAFASMRKSLLDEIAADYMGMVEALGRFDAALFLRFMGLEDPAGARPGGRLEQYRGHPPLSDRAFSLLPGVARRAAAALETFDAARGSGRIPVADKAHVITALFRVGLEGLGADEAAELLAHAFQPAPA